MITIAKVERPSLCGRLFKLILIPLCLSWFVSIELWAVESKSVISIVAGKDAHTLLLTSEGLVWATGRNAFGQLGEGTKTSRSRLVQVKNLTDVVAIAPGRYHSLALTEDGRVWGWGRNQRNRFQLGHETFKDSTTPIVVENLNEVITIAPGFHHNLVIRQDGSLWAWGFNESGQLGEGTRTSRSAPVQVKKLKHVIDIAASRNHSLAITEEGTVWAWGSNKTGQLGDGTQISRKEPVQVEGLTDIIAIAAGLDHSLALSQEGTVWAWGTDSSGRLGDEARHSAPVTTPVQVELLTDVVAISSGYNHSLALTEGGQVWAWGGNQVSGKAGEGIVGVGKLGAGLDENSRSVPVRVKNLRNMVAISAGWSHSVALSETGMVWIWGGNSHGQLGEGTETHRELPILMPFPCQTCLADKPCLCFEQKKACYEMDEALLVSLNIQVEPETTLEGLDLYVVLDVSQQSDDSLSPFLYLIEETPANAFMAEMIPYRGNITLQSEKIILLDQVVTQNIQGDYILYAGFVDAGEKAEVSALLSNLAQTKISLEENCSVRANTANELLYER